MGRILLLPSLALGYWRGRGVGVGVIRFRRGHKDRRLIESLYVCERRGVHTWLVCVHIISDIRGVQK